MTNKNIPSNISVTDALQWVDRLTITPLETTVIPAGASVGRVLADDVRAQRDIPRADNSAMDGFLFLNSDLNEGIRTYALTGEIKPEDETGKLPKSKSCLRIMTGAPVPEGNVMVIPVEQTNAKGTTIEVMEVPQRNAIRKKGEGYQKGKTVLTQNKVIRPYEMGLLIESGNRECCVYRPATIAVQVTGSEINEDLNTNGPVLEGLMQGWPGVKVKSLPVLPDDFESVMDRMNSLAGNFDMVCTTGGISMGARDYILPAMEQLGAEVIFRNILQKPGKPMTLTKLKGTLFFHLPGNPISATFCAELYVLRAIQNLNRLPVSGFKVKASNPLQNLRGGKTLFAPGKLFLDGEQGLAVKSEGKMQSHLLQLYRNNDVYVRMEPESTYAKGDLIEVIPFSSGIEL